MKDLSRMSDIELLSLMKNGDSSSFHYIFLRYNKSLYVTAYSKLRDKEEARDVVQDVLATLWQKREEIAIRNGQLSPYLYAAVRYRVLDIIARKKRASQHVEDLQAYQKQFDDIADNYLRERLLMEILSREISFLPDRMRQIFLLSRYDNLSHKEIAQKMNIANSTVTHQVKKALKILRSKLRHLFFVLLFIFFNFLYPLTSFYSSFLSNIQDDRDNCRKNDW